LPRRSPAPNHIGADTPLSADEAESSRWFTEHVQPHEGMLRAWLRSRFPDGE
jgi:hypothetical protein